MNLTKSFEKLKNRVSPYVEKVQPYVKKAKVYGVKALDYTVKQAQTTALFIRTEEAFNIHASAKRSILIAYDESDEDVKNILLFLPLWASKAWIDNAELRYISLAEDKDLGKTLKIKGPIEMRVSFNGEEYMRTNKINDIKKWWNNRCYTEKTEKAITPAPETNTPTDPLAGK